MYKKVFICSPFRGDVIQMSRNITRAREMCNLAAQMDCIPIAPHLIFPQFLDEYDEEQRDLGIDMGLELLKECDEVWVHQDAKGPTEGMRMEIELAEKLEKPLRFIRTHYIK